MAEQVVVDSLADAGRALVTDRGPLSPRRAVGGLVGFWINYGVSKHIAPGTTQWLTVRRRFTREVGPGGRGSS